MFNKDLCLAHFVCSLHSRNEPPDCTAQSICWRL